MVDTNGVLFSLIFSSFTSLAEGPVFELYKFTPNTNSTITSTKRYLYTGSVPGDATNVVDEGNGVYGSYYLSSYKGIPIDNARRLVRYTLHNLLSPTIAQEMNNESSVFVVGLGAPASRWGCGYSASDKCYRYEDSANWPNEPRLVLWKINKNSLSVENNKEFKYTSVNNKSDNFLCPLYQPVRSRQSYSKLDAGRTADADVLNLNSYEYTHKPQPEWGPLRGALIGDRLNVYMLNNWGYSIENAHLNVRYQSHVKSTLEKSTEATYVISWSNWFPDATMMATPQAVGNTFYCGGFQGCPRFCTLATSGGTWKYQFSGYCDALTGGYARYPFTFCLLPNNGNPILCYLDLNYNKNWGNSVNWASEKISCNLYSRLINGGSAARSYAPNTLYVTDVTSKSGDLVGPNNTTAADIKRLYLNTQNIVAYTSASGHNYIIYAYCYPGKTKQCFLGYAPYYVDAENFVHLLTKHEFRDKDNNSFGNFTSCSRIISMDLKNSHLWITFMNSVSNEYYYFHILAKDLVGE